MDAKINGVILLLVFLSTSCCHHPISSSKPDYDEAIRLMDQTMTLQRDVEGLRGIYSPEATETLQAKVHGLHVEKSDLLKIWQKSQQKWRQGSRTHPVQYSQNPQPDEVMSLGFPPLFFSDTPLSSVVSIINDELKRICPKSCQLRLSASDQISSRTVSVFFYGGSILQIINIITNLTETSWSLVGNTIEIKSIEQSTAP
jgi:hypothetical protein